MALHSLLWKSHPSSLLPAGLSWSPGPSPSCPPTWRFSLSFEVELQSCLPGDKPGLLPALTRLDGLFLLVPGPAVATPQASADCIVEALMGLPGQMGNLRGSGPVTRGWCGCHGTRAPNTWGRPPPPRPFLWLFQGEGHTRSRELSGAQRCISLVGRPPLYSQAWQKPILGWGFSWSHPNAGPTPPGFPFLLPPMGIL